MRNLLFVFSAFAVIGLAFWAYQENYRTQETMKEVRILHRQIGNTHARLSMLRAEWAYLNRPDRLLDLSELNFERLGLMPLMPDAFGRVDQVMYPPEPVLPILNAIEVSSDGILSEVEPL